MNDEQHISLLRCASKREVMLYDLLCHYKWGHIGSLRQLAEVVESTIGEKYSISTLQRKVRKLEQHVQEGANSSEQMHQQSLDQIRESRESLLCGRKTLSQQLRTTLITLPEKGGVRQYTCIRRTHGGECEYYRCNSCTRLRRKTGFGRIAYIRVQNGCVISGKAAQHHPNCEVIDETSALTKAIDRQCRVQVRNGQSNPHSAYRKGFKRAIELASLYGGRIGRKFTVATAFPSWQRVRSAYFRMQRERLKEKSIPYSDTVDAVGIDRYGSSGNQDDHVKVELSTGSLMDIVESASSEIPSDSCKKAIGKMERDISKANTSTSPPNTISVAESTAPAVGSDGDVADNVTTEPMMSNVVPSFSRARHTQPCHSLCESRVTPSEACSQTVLPSASRLLKMGSRSKTISSGNTIRQHYLTRDRRTGHITVCKWMPLQTATKHLPFQRPLLRNLNNTGCEILNGNTEFGGTNQNWIHSNSVDEEIVSTPLHCFFKKKPPCFPRKKSTKTHFKREAKENDTLPSKTLLKKASRLQQRDECDNIGDSIVECLREIGRANAEKATQFKVELMEMMAKYRKTNCATQATFAH